MYKTHLVFGLFFGLLFVNLFNVSNKILFLGIVAIASLFPDIDAKRSVLSSKLINWLFGHRKLFHSIWPLVVFYLVFNKILKLNLIGSALIIGYGSHLLSDTFNKEGTRFFYPLKLKQQGFIRAGSFLEWLFFILFLILVIIGIINLF